MRNLTRLFSLLTAVLLLGVCGARGGEEAAANVTAIEVVGCVTKTPTQIKGMMGTREGQPLDKNVLAEDFKRLSKMEEIADVQIKEKDEAGGVRIMVLIREKDIVRRIFFRGNQKGNAKKLKELVKSEEGQRYSPGQANRDRRAIEDWYKEEFYYFAKVEAKVEPFEDGIRLVFDIDEGGRLYVSDLVLRGNKTFTRKQLFKFMETKPSTFLTKGKYDRRIFEKDLERLRMYYQSEGFLDVKVTEQPFEITASKSGSRREACIYLDIEEGDRYKVGRVDFDGNKLVDTEALRAVVETMPGETFSPLKVQNDANKIRDIYGKYPSSRYFTKVFGERVLTPAGPVVDVLFHVKEGDEVIVEDVQIIGLQKTKDYVFRRQVDVMPGEKIDSMKINSSKRNIANLGYTKNLNFDVREGSAPNRAKVVVDVEEGTTGKLALGAGISSDESFIGSVTLNQRNFDHRDWPDSWKDLVLGKAFVGGGQNFNLNISAGSKTQDYSVDWMEPWVFGKPLRFGLGGFYKTWEWDEYDEQRMGGYVRLGKQLFNNRNFDGSITYRLEEVTLDNFEDDVSREMKDEEGSNIISRVIFNLTYDSRDNRFDPTDGILLSASQEFAGTILMGDKDFWKTTLRGNYYHPLFKDKQDRPWYMAIRGEFGAVEAFGEDEHVPVYEKLYSGGMGSIRGFENRTVSPHDSAGNAIGGEMKVTAGMEFFAPVYENIVKISAFYDVGTVWAQLDESTTNWRSSFGFGLHVKTPLGPMPIRMYWAQVIDDVEGDDHQQFQFTFGANF
jgi:outer membrane protein insertion porin family